MARTPTERELRTLRGFAHDLVAEAGEGLAERRARTRRVATQRKGEGDFVTALDVSTERRLRRSIAEHWPEHGFLGEESGGVGLDREFVWIVDPIDGTSNFAQGLPHWSTAVACLRNGRPIAAACYCAPEHVTYSAARGLGARRGTRRLELPKRRHRLGDDAVIGVQWHRGPRDLEFVARLTATGTRIRVLGSSVTHLCDVAVGRLDANVQEQGKIWDLAAAALIAVEAGAKATDWSGRALLPFPDYDGDRHYASVVTAPGGGAHRQLLDLLGAD